jgi:predicted O-methyltransferase YrrM
MARLPNWIIGIGDLIYLQARHPLWFGRELLKYLIYIRAFGNARLRHHLGYADHHQLDPAFAHLSVEIGGCPIDQSRALIVTRFCKFLRPKKVLEIGTHLGAMTWHIARNTDDDCHIWTLDLPREKLAGMSRRMIDSDVALARMDENKVGEFWHGMPECSKITQLWGDSLNYDFSSLGPLDLIYVDGSHAYPWVQKDTENAFLLLAPTGAILWDDCYWRDVQRVLSYYAKTRPIYCFEDNRTAGYLQIKGKPVQR